MAKTTKKITVAIADDHSLLRSALAKLINTFEVVAAIVWGVAGAGFVAAFTMALKERV